MRPRRYQLTKDAIAILDRGHPWLFRAQLSTAAQVFADGDWLRLVDGQNKVVAHGIYESEGAIAIRLLRRGPAPVDATYLNDVLRAALTRREPLAKRTNAMRLVQGESDGLPAVAIDRFANTLVVSSYSAGADLLARYAAHALYRAESPVLPTGGARNIILRPAHRRRSASEVERQGAEDATGLDAGRTSSHDGTVVLAGVMPSAIELVEDDLPFSVDVAGQKTGAYLDLRALRRAVVALPLQGARVLNLFAYSGMLGRAAERAGATEIVQVDASAPALAFAAAHHVDDAAKHRFLVEDVFEWLPGIDATPEYDLVIVDPPAMTSRSAQIPTVLAAYRKLYRGAMRVVKPGGLVVAACCTSRIERKVFEKTVHDTLGRGFVREKSLPPEADHPVGFPQADYLKIIFYRRRAA